MFIKFFVFLVFASLLVEIHSETRIAIAHLISSNVTGSIVFTETEGGLHVTGSIVGLDAGKYGFHVHELGDISTCDATGAHFNPDGNTHGGRDHKNRHVGDLGNIQFVGNRNAVANVDFVDNVISLRGRNSIIGRALVLHEQEDDLGLGGNEGSLNTGNAGSRVACGVIGLRSPSDPWNSSIKVIPSLFLLAFVILLVLRVL